MEQVAQLCNPASVNERNPDSIAKDLDRHSTVRGSLLRQVIGSIFLALLVAGASSVSLWLLLGRPELPETGTALSVADLYSGLRISLAVVAGAGGVVALVVAYRRQRFNEAQHVVSTRANAREETKLYGERFKVASEQLGSPEAAVRLGGVYAMFSLASDWQRGRQMCVDVLCGYLRMPFEIPASDNELAYSEIYSKGPRRKSSTDSTSPLSGEVKLTTRQEFQVRLAIQRTLAAHLRDSNTENEREEVLDFWPGIRIDLFGATLCNFDFAGCEAAVLDLRRATFLGDAKLNGMTVANETRVDSAEFFGGAIFSRSNFGDNASFCGAKFRRDASWAGAKFAVDGEFNGAFFGGAALFAKAKFGGGAWYPNAQFAGIANFSSSVAEDGHRLKDAQVDNPGLPHSWPSGFRVVNGKLAPV
ncbi:hypothetical protein KZ829_04920 [Actinoplanes hulinensis]|uniref:Pentapeptide repeat-containing protein n=1 Tax=Actinoplanes hulinensis TaxID=1144547 RepID=A0ABS7AWJ8_9ACTN|nr:hypothetical protein [Actinoplanes hulinensis]MBW6433085.1 hypothetical protein [Actinoplanes hulinensis]